MSLNTSEYIKLLNKANYKFRRTLPFKIEVSDNLFKITLFDKVEINIENGFLVNLENKHATIASLVEESLQAAYFRHLRDVFGQKSVVSTKRMPKTVRFAKKNQKLSEIARTVQIQISKNLNGYRLACRYFGIKPNIREIEFIAKMPKWVFELEPAYIHSIYTRFPNGFSSNKFKNKIDVYKFVHSNIGSRYSLEKSKAIIKMLPKLSYTAAQPYIHLLQLRFELDKLASCCEGSPYFARFILQRIPIRTVDFRMNDDLFNHILKSAATYSLKKGKSKSTAHKIQEILDWARVKNPTLDKNQRKQGFPYLVNKSDEWHAEVHEKEFIEENAIDWTPLLGDVEKNEIKVSELHTSLALYKEGKAMHHCVGSYADMCRTYNSVVFHISSKNPATVEFGIRGKKVNLAQIRGKYNCRIQPTDTAYKVAQYVQRLLNKRLENPLPAIVNRPNLKSYVKLEVLDDVPF